MKQILTLFGFAACCHPGLGIGCGFGDEGSLEEKVGAGMPTGRGSARRAAAGSGDDLEQRSAVARREELPNLAGCWEGDILAGLTGTHMTV